MMMLNCLSMAVAIAMPRFGFRVLMNWLLGWNRPGWRLLSAVQGAARCFAGTLTAIPWNLFRLFQNLNECRVQGSFSFRCEGLIEDICDVQHVVCLFADSCDTGSMQTDMLGHQNLCHS